MDQKPSQDYASQKNRKHLINALLIEDCAEDVTLIKKLLIKDKRYDWQVIDFDTMKAARKYLDYFQDKINLILLDLGLPDTKGHFDTLESLGPVKKDIPTVVVTAADDDDLASELIEKGAQDFINKSLLVKRPESFYNILDFSLKRHEFYKDNLKQNNTQKEHNIAARSMVAFGELFLDHNRMSLFDGDRNETKLTTAEYRLLNVLILHPQKVLSRDQILKLTKNEKYDVYDRSIDVLISRIRNKLENNYKISGYIKTVTGIGYMLDVEAKTIKKM